MWDQFWRSGRGACCVVHDGANYSEDLRKPWVSFLSEIKESDRLLDLCTGNGALLKIALQQAKELGVSVRLEGVDMAQIEAPVDGIKIHSDTSVTDLPFDDDAFDYVTSQFGIEYTPLERSCEEALRVLRPGGKGRFITHASAGVTVEYAKREIDDLDDLLNHIDVFPAAAEAIKLMCDIERKQIRSTSEQVEQARVARNTFHEKLTLIGDTWQQRSAKDAFRDVGSILQHTLQNRFSFPVQTLLDKVSETEEAIELHRDRLNALIVAALSRDDCEKLVRQLRKLGCTKVDVNPVRDAAGQKMLGWCIDFET